MKGKRIAWILLIISLLMVGFFPSITHASKVIRFSHELSPNPYEPTHAYALVFKNYVESRTEGEYTVQIFPANVLGGMREILEQVTEGTIQVAQVSVGGASLVYKPILILNTPFIYGNDKVTRYVWDRGNPFIQWLFEGMYEATGILPVDVFERGGLSIITNDKRPLRRPEDFRGIQFRAMDDSQIAMYRALGGDGIPIAWEEVYTALQTGVADGQTNPITIVVDASFYEVQKYATLAGAVPGSGMIVFNDDWYTNLPDDMKEIVDDAIHFAGITSSGLTQLSQALGLQKLIEEGMEVTALTTEEQATLNQLGSEGVLAWARVEMGDEVVERFLNAIEEARRATEY